MMWVDASRNRQVFQGYFIWISMSFIYRKDCVSRTLKSIAKSMSLNKHLLSL